MKILSWVKKDAAPVEPVVVEPPAPPPPLADPAFRRMALQPFSDAIDAFLAVEGKQLNIPAPPLAYTKPARGVTLGYNRQASPPLMHMFRDNDALEADFGRGVHYVMDVRKGSRSKFLSLEFEAPLEILPHLAKVNVLLSATCSKPINIGVSIFLNQKGQGPKRLKSGGGTISPTSTRFVSTIDFDPKLTAEPERYTSVKLSLMFPSNDDYTLSIFDIRTLGTLRLPQH